MSTPGFLPYAVLALACVGYVATVVREQVDETEAEAAADRATAAADPRRQAIETLCRQDGGEPIAGVREVVCLERYATNGKGVVMWRRAWR